MKRLKTIADFLTFSKKERIGILTLVILIVATLLAPAFLSKNAQLAPLSDSDTAWIARLQSSLIVDSTTEKRSYAQPDENVANYQFDRSTSGPSTTATLFPFDPNTITKEQWKKLGLRDKTIQTITNYLSKGGHFYKPEDLKKIYGLRENDYERLVPYISIAKSHQTTSSQPQTSSTPTLLSEPKTTFTSIIEINTADKEALIQLPGIGNTFALRIINFREKLGGFYTIQQVSETYGLPDSTFQKIKSRLRVEESLIRRININTASAEELKAHPYLRSVATTIINYRKEHGSFSSVNQIKNTGVVTEDIYNKISHYLTIQ